MLISFLIASIVDSAVQSQSDMLPMMIKQEPSSTSTPSLSAITWSRLVVKSMVRDALSPIAENMRQLLLRVDENCGQTERMRIMDPTS